MRICYTILSEMRHSLQTLGDAEQALRPYVPLVAQLTGADTTLQRIKPLMKLLGNPEQKLKIIHIAGTSGKTSTSYYIAGLLQAAGQKVGLTVSPHVDKLSERVQINGQPLSDLDFCAELEIFLKLVKSADQAPSYFELLYAFAIWEFARQQVDYAVVETGMGGLYDATNVAARADKVCVITDIGYDHMHILGDTLPEIAAQKIGIVHSGNVALTYQQSPEIMAVFSDWTSQHQAQLIELYETALQADYGHELAELPMFQRRNWLLAREVYIYLQTRDSLPVLSKDSERSTQRLQVPARMEISQVAGKTIIMDGAHNEQKMTAFVSSFRDRYPAARPAILVALKAGKEYHAVSPILANLASRIIVTTFDTSQDLPAQSMDPELFAKALRVAGAKNVEIVADQRKAYDTLMALSETVYIITGSFYLLSQLRQAKKA